MKKYKDLTRELRKAGNASVTVVLIEVGVVSNLEEELIKLNIDQKKIPKVQFAAVRGSGRSLGSPGLVVLTREHNKLNPVNKSLCYEHCQ